MTLYFVVVIAVGLAMDAFAVAISSGAAVRPMQFKYALRIAVFFGLFQALMPLVGWLGGMELKKIISGVDHWIVFALLVLIGSRMIIVSIKPEQKKQNQKVRTPMLLMLSLATSMDALAVGLGFSFMQMEIIVPVVIIGVVTFILSFLGVWIGSCCGHLIGRRFEAIGGLILIAMGFKILIGHLAG